MLLLLVRGRYVEGPRRRGRHGVDWHALSCYRGRQAEGRRCGVSGQGGRYGARSERYTTARGQPSCSCCSGAGIGSGWPCNRGGGCKQPRSERLPDGGGHRERREGHILRRLLLLLLLLGHGHARVLLLGVVVVSALLLLLLLLLLGVVVVVVGCFLLPSFFSRCLLGVARRGGALLPRRLRGLEVPHEVTVGIEHGLHHRLLCRRRWLRLQWRRFRVRGRGCSLVHRRGAGAAAALLLLLFLAVVAAVAAAAATIDRRQHRVQR